MKKLTLEDLEHQCQLHEDISNKLLFFNEFSEKLAKCHQGNLGVQPTLIGTPMRVGELHDFLNAIPKLQPIERPSMTPDVEVAMKATLRRSKLSTQMSEIDYEIFEEIMFAKVFDLKDMFPNFSRQTTLVMSSKQQADSFYERYIEPISKPKVKLSPLNQAIQNHLNKESDND